MSRVYTIPAPTGGWNTQNDFDNMPETDAVALVNFVCRNRHIELRKGSAEHCDGVGSSGVETLAEYSGEDGVRKLIACGDGGIYDASASGVSATSKATGFTEDRWQWVNFKDKLILVNGTDQPQQYDPTAGVAAANYTGITNDAALIQVSVYNERLYFIEKNSTSIWYGAAAAITGAVTELDVGDQLRRGGNLLFAGSWTRDTGGGVTDLFVIVSSMGEVLVYSGGYPGGADWGKVGRFYLAEPLGRRAVTNIGADLVVLTQDGVEPFSNLLAEGTEGGILRGKISEKINDSFREAAENYGANTGWEAINFPRGQFALVNIPTATNTSAEQYVMNTETGAWSKFEGMNALCWGLYDGNLFFGGTDGKVYQSWTGANDDGDYIEGYCKCAFNYMRDRSNIKLLHMIKPLIMGDQAITLDVGADVDFSDVPWSASVELDGAPGSAWDSAQWDESYWDDNLIPSDEWYGLTGIGRAIAIKFGGFFKNAEFNVSAIPVMFERGGYI